MLDNLIVDDSSDDEDTTDLTTLASLNNKLVGLVVAFCLTFRIFYNIPDRAIVVLLRFFRYIFQLVGSMFQVNIEINIPLSLQKCYALLGLRKTPFTEYLSCPSCHLLFNSDALLATNIRPELITYPFVEFPNHPQQRFRLPCNATLFIKVQKRGEIKFKPCRVYYYYGLKSAFCVLLNRPEFLLKCNLWSESRNSRRNLSRYYRW